MKGKSVCECCEKEFEWTRYGNRNAPRFCSHPCRLKNGGTGAIEKPRLKISDMSEEEKMRRLKKSFEKHVIRQEGCWGWKGPTARGGYAVMSCRRAMGSDRGHKASWMIHFGSIPARMHVCHKCDNPICTNPDHLWIGTHQQNNDDKISKGRQAHNIPPHKRGSENGSSKLSENQVKEIKGLILEGHSCHRIGKEFGVSHQTILRIKNGKNWKHITETAC